MEVLPSDKRVIKIFDGEIENIARELTIVMIIYDHI